MFNLSSFRNTPYSNQFVFAGKMFQWQYNSGFINGKTNIHIKTSTSQITHIISRTLRTASTGINFKFVENAVIVTSGTTVLPSYNVSRILSNVSKNIIYKNVPAATSGLAFENITLVSGNTWQQITPELILKSGTNYNLRITNSGTSTKAVDFYFVWYESNN
jgi:hypothetical protein